MTDHHSDQPHTCATCLRLSDMGICRVASPTGGRVIAARGWKPSSKWLTVPHACSAYRAKPEPAA